MGRLDLLDLYNLIALWVFIISSSLIAGKLFFRLLQFWKFKIPVPILLKRDLFLFWSIVIYLGGGLIALVLGTQNLGKEPLWVIPRSFLLLSSFIYWAWVEYRIIDNTEKRK